MCLAVPGRIRDVKPVQEWMYSGTVDFGGVLREVNLSCVPEAVPGDYVLVHVGVAISILPEEEAIQCLAELEHAGVEFEYEEGLE